MGGSFPSGGGGPPIRVAAREVRRCLALMLKALGWTQTRVAESLGVAKSTLSEFVRGESAPNELDESVLRDAVAAGPAGDPTGSEAGSYPTAFRGRSGTTFAPAISDSASAIARSRSAAACW